MASNPRASRERPRIGRPPAGARAGERVKDYPQLSIRLPIDVKAKLQALSVAASRPQWRIVTEAIDCYLHDLSEDEQRKIAALAGRLRSRPRRSRSDRRSGRPTAARQTGPPR